MTKRQSAMRSKHDKPAIKYKGIYMPKDRVKRYRVEIRLSKSWKIWVGTFDTLQKAMRAYDAAVYHTGKEPYYFIYPATYFPGRHTTKPRSEFADIVKAEAKKFADRTDALQVNPSFLVRTSSEAGSVVEASRERITPDVKPDVKASDPSVSLGESSKNANNLTVSAEQFPDLEEANSCRDPQFEESNLSAVGEEAKVDEKGLAAFDKGYHNPDSALIADLLHQDLLVDIYPPIEGVPSTPFSDVSEFLPYFD